MELWLPLAWPSWTWHCCMVCRGKCTCHRQVIMMANHQLLQQVRACGGTNDFALCDYAWVRNNILSRYLLKSWTALCPAGDRAASNYSLSFAKRKGLTFGLRDAFCNFAGFLHDLAKICKDGEEVNISFSPWRHSDCMFEYVRKWSQVFCQRSQREKANNPQQNSTRCGPNMPKP